MIDLRNIRTNKRSRLWTPADAGVLQWTVGDDAVLDGNGKVSSIPAHQGIGGTASQSNAAIRPVVGNIGGHKTFSTVGIAGYLDVVMPAKITGDLSVLWVARGINFGYVAFFSAATYLALFYLNDATIRAYSAFFSASMPFGTPLYQQNEAGSFGVSFDRTNNLMDCEYRGNVNDHDSSSSEPGPGGTDELQALAFGNYRAGPDIVYGVEIAEVAVFPRKLSTSELHLWSAYSLDKYGVP